MTVFSSIHYCTKFFDSYFEVFSDVSTKEFSAEGRIPVVSKIQPAEPILLISNLVLPLRFSSMEQNKTARFDDFHNVDTLPRGL